MHSTVITLGGEEFEMRPTFKAICDIERQIGKGVLPLLQQITANGGVSTMEAGIIIHSGIRAVLGNKAPSLDDIGNRIMQVGLAEVLPTIVEFLMPVLSGQSGDAAENKESTKN